MALEEAAELARVAMAQKKLGDPVSGAFPLSSPPSLRHLLRYELSDLNSRTETAHSGSNVLLLQNKNETDIVIKHIRKLSEFYRAFKISDFEN